MQGQSHISQRLDRAFAAPMFCLALMTLGFFATLIYLDDLEHDDLIVKYSLIGIAILYPFFWIETLIHWLAGSRFLKQHVWFCVLPITRIGCRDHVSGTSIWLPGLGWGRVNKKFERKLARKFSVPMIAVALMVLPIIIVEFFYRDFVDRNLAWRVVMAIAEAFIWAAFTFEFVLMIKVVRAKIAYARKHWIDLAVILLPMLAFMRMMRLGSVGRINQLSRTAKVFRLRGLAMRLWRAFVALEIIEMLLYRNPELRLEKLQQKFEMKMEEVSYLKEDIQRLRTRVAERQAEAEAARLTEANTGRKNATDPTDLPKQAALEDDSESSGNHSDVFDSA